MQISLDRTIFRADESESGATSAANWRHPMEVAYHALLSAAQKRRILTQWAASVGTVDATPFMRRDSRTGAIARMDEITEALRALDDEDARHVRARRDPSRAAIQLLPREKRRLSASGVQSVWTLPRMGRSAGLS